MTTDQVGRDPQSQRSPSHSADARQAALALDANRPREAERIAIEALARSPRDGHALHILGCALLMQGRAKEAIAPLEAALHGRHDPEIETLLAMALRRVGRPDEAVERLKRSCKRHPPYAPAFLELGAVLSSIGRHQEAIKVLRRGLDIAPMMPQLSIARGYAYLDSRDPTNAKAEFARALEILPGSADALVGMARAQRASGDAKTAADYFRRCLASNPNEHQAWNYLGHCLLELGQLDAGYDCFRTAGRRDPRGWGHALSSLTASRRGRLWLRPSAAQRFLASPERQTPSSTQR
jgi:tetratricopeptide (TPR) repeat protein